ncbi:hypothetical protein HYC85_026889 [Camellia sinensis]|uniref:Uncharacterized protein n=1 Tax=Camellia sinensis TaxID=4442 RepID=A0A7J7G4W1_CAMSI|nr:hypothetical protein HYC85_026889 [Camellia sinensis]
MLFMFSSVFNVDVNNDTSQIISQKICRRTPARIHYWNCVVKYVSVPLLHHYGQFYDSLLSLHFKFNDVDAASGLILDIYRCDESLHSKKYRKDPQKPYLVPIGSHNLRAGLKIQILPELLQKDSKEELFIYKNGKVVLSNKGMAKLILQ